MLRGLGYVIARQDQDDPEEPRDWALFIEAIFRGLVARFANRAGRHRPPATPERPHGRESASARRPR